MHCMLMQQLNPSFVVQGAEEWVDDFDVFAAVKVVDEVLHFGIVFIEGVG